MAKRIKSQGMVNRWRLAVVIGLVPLVAVVAAPVPSAGDLTSDGGCRTSEHGEVTTNRCCTCGEDEDGFYCHGGAFLGVDYCDLDPSFCAHHTRCRVRVVTKPGAPQE